MKGFPRSNIISFRINDEEREVVLDLVEKSGRSISDLVREALSLLVGDEPDSGSEDSGIPG